MQMKSVGETMAIGRTFKESLQKALRGLEIGHFGLGGGKKDRWGTPKQPSMHEIRRKLSVPNDERIFFIRYAFKAGLTVEDIHELTEIDPWFLRNIRDLDRRRGRNPPGRSARRRERGPDPEGEAQRLFRPSARFVVEHDRNGGPPAAQETRHRGDVQAGRHVRGRVRGLHAVLLLDLRAGRRNAGQDCRAASGS